MLRDNLIMLRNVRGLTQEQVAEIVGVTRQSYAKWEQGDSVPDIEKCEKSERIRGNLYFKSQSQNPDKG